MLMSFFFMVGHHVQLHVGHPVHLHVDHHDVISMLCEGSETLLEWKSESIARLKIVMIALGKTSNALNRRTYAN